MKIKPEPGKSYYMYHYVDPRTGHVRYVGIGKYKSGGRVRAFSHLNSVKGGKSCQNSHLDALLKKLLSLGLTPEVRVVAWFATGEECCAAEVAEIAKYKRKVDGGLLCNFTRGGDGTWGFSRPHDEEAKAKIAVTSKTRWQDPAYREKRASALRAGIGSMTPEALAARAEKIAAAWTPEKRAAAAAATVAAMEKRFGKKQPKVPLTDAQRAQLRVELMAAAQSPEALEKRSASMQALWQDADYLEKMRKRAKPDMSKCGDAMRAGIANMDPETKARLSAIRSANKKAWHAARKSASLTP